MKTTSFAIFAALTIAGTSAPAAEKSAPPAFDSGTISGLGIRNIGSATMSGRIAALDAIANKDGKTLLYVGAASGGVWKSTDGGTNFKPVFDKQNVQSIGAITIDPSHHDTVWVGTGEAWTRNSVSIGDGIYKSTDGGNSWTNMGLPLSERIAKIVVDPHASDTVYACVPGKLWSDSADRGLYKTTDGGQHWQQILKGGNLSTGCASIGMDPKDSNVLFASLWDFRRKGWTFRSGGESPTSPSGSGLFRSADAGKTWTEITDTANKGFPKKPFGRIAVSIAPSDAKIVYAFVESTDSALFRSDDGGKTWDKRDKSQLMVWRPFYFASLVIDPTNPERLFKPDLRLAVSNDGGKSFSDVGGGSHGDHHVQWIDPSNPQHIFTGDDGGLWQSFDGGNRWWKQNNLPVSQFYHVSLDDADPYHVYGGLQDNACWIGDSAYPGGITNSRWENVCGGDGFFMFPDPSDPNYVYAETQGGEVQRVNRETKMTRSLKPLAGYNEKMRFNWNTPLALSPNEKGTIYIGSQFLFRSRDHGQSWERISPDLTTNDPLKQKQEESGGVTVDNSAAEMYTTIYSISESPKQSGLIWVGTDDGNVQITRDGGKNWTNVVKNVPGVPEHAWVSWVEASHFDAGTAYVAFDCHTFGDTAPYIYKTTDFGKTWSALVTPKQPKGLRGYVHVVKDDVEKPNIVFAGTEFGLWISIDSGVTWAQFKGNDFPAVAVRDFDFQKRDDSLVLATHGRGMWIIDDLTPLRALDSKTLTSEAVFLPSKPIQQRIAGFGGWPEGDASYAGLNPHDGADIVYYQKSRHLYGKLKIEVLDDKGNLIDTIPASVRRGINHVYWSMRGKPPRVPPAAQVAFNSTQGGLMPPGDYTIRMTKGDQIFKTTIHTAIDRRATYNAADRQKQYEATLRVRDLFGEMSDLVYKINAVRTQADADAAKTHDDALIKQLKSLSSDADDIRRKIVATKEGGAITGEQRLREYSDDLYGEITTFDGAPTDYQLERIDVLKRETDEVIESFDKLQKDNLAKANASLKSANMEAITVPAAAPQEDSSGGAHATGEQRRPFERD